jgi:hypothetical protein
MKNARAMMEIPSRLATPIEYRRVGFFLGVFSVFGSHDGVCETEARAPSPIATLRVLENIGGPGITQVMISIKSWGTATLLGKNRLQPGLVVP